MPQRLRLRRLEQSILDLMRDNGGSLRVELDGDHSAGFLELLDEMADRGVIEAADGMEAGLTYSLPTPPSESRSSARTQ